MKYLTWHRTESSRSSSSRNPLGGLNCDDVEELNSNLFENICMIAGSHASTLDRLFAWERKLYDEVKVLIVHFPDLTNQENALKICNVILLFFMVSGESNCAKRV